MKYEVGDSVCINHNLDKNVSEYEGRFTTITEV